MLLPAACREAPPPSPEDRGAPAASRVEAGVPPVASARPSPRRGLWVLCEGSQRALERPERRRALLRDAARLGATDLFVQVYRGGRAWFDSTWADAGPFERMVAAQGLDPLRALIRDAHAGGLRVHAWVNVLSLAGNREAPLLARLGPAAAMVDHRGRSVLDYRDFDLSGEERRYLRMGTPQLWIDPAAPGVAEYLSATFAELFERYPELDGLHLDYLRHPDVLPFSPGSRFGVGLHFGYGEATRRRFFEETGLEAPFGDRLRNAAAWDRWRREKVTELLAAVRERVLAARPDAVISAAVWPWPARAYLSLLQDWRGWLEAGLLDLAVPMLYTTDDHLFRLQARSLAGEPAADRIWPGIGVWLFSGDPSRARRQVDVARAAGFPGEVLFSWDSLAEHPPLLARLAEPDPVPATTSAAHRDPEAAGAGAR